MKKKILILFVGLMLMSGCASKMSDSQKIEDFDKALEKEGVEYIKFESNQGVTGQKSGYIYTMVDEGPFYVTVFDKPSDDFKNAEKEKCVTISGTNGTYKDCSITINENMILHFGQNSINSKETVIVNIFKSIK